MLVVAASWVCSKIIDRETSLSRIVKPADEPERFHILRVVTVFVISRWTCKGDGFRSPTYPSLFSNMVRYSKRSYDAGSSIHECTSAAVAVSAEGKEASLFKRQREKGCIPLTFPIAWKSGCIVDPMAASAVYEKLPSADAWRSRPVVPIVDPSISDGAVTD